MIALVTQQVPGMQLDYLCEDPPHCERWRKSSLFTCLHSLEEIPHDHFLLLLNQGKFYMQKKKNT